MEALYTNVSRPLGYQSSTIWDSLGFAALLFSFGYVALQMVFESERRLLSIENELAIAREIQTSILPSGSPEIKNLRITAAYHPMTTVAGDFYDFIPQPDYPVRDILICPGDRLLLYTDGVIEPENAKANHSGTLSLEQVVLGSQMCSPCELTERLLTEIRAWQPASVAQLDDITLVVIDVR